MQDLLYSASAWKFEEQCSSAESFALVAKPVSLSCYTRPCTLSHANPHPNVCVVLHIHYFLCDVFLCAMSNVRKKYLTRPVMALLFHKRKSIQEESGSCPVNTSRRNEAHFGSRMHNFSCNNTMLGYLLPNPSVLVRANFV